MLHAFSSAIPVAIPAIPFENPSIDSRSPPEIPHELDIVSQGSSGSTIEARADVANVPGVTQIKAQIVSFGIAQSKPDLFYTKYPINLNVALQWGSNYFDEDIGATKANWKFAVWGRLVSSDYSTTVQSDLRQTMTNAKFSENRIKKYEDMFAKNMCQAFAETAHGDVIVLIKATDWPDNKFDANTCWGGKLFNLVDTSRT